MIARNAVASLILLALAGCVSQREPVANASLEGLVQPVPGAAAPVAQAPDAALMRLRDGRSRIVSVSERRTGVMRRQDILLDAGRNAPRNRIAILLQDEPGRSDETLAKPSEAGIRSEIAASFPGLAMTVAPQPRTNALGPYGLAVGRGPGAQRCVYAWQWLGREDREVSQRLGGNASWRARICRSDMTLDQIAADLDGVDFGRAEARIASLEALSLAPAPRAVRVAQPRPASPAIAQKGHDSRQPGTALRSARPPFAQSDSAPGGAHYLAPVALVGSASQPDQPQTTRTALDASLPAEAYRGPASRSGFTTGSTLRAPSPQ